MGLVHSRLGVPQSCHTVVRACLSHFKGKDIAEVFLPLQIILHALYIYFENSVDILWVYFTVKPTEEGILPHRDLHQNLSQENDFEVNLIKTNFMVKPLALSLFRRNGYYNCKRFFSWVSLAWTIVISHDGLGLM